MIWESEVKQSNIDAIRFGDYLKDYNVKILPNQYKEFMLMDILHMTKKDIEELEHIEYKEMIDYATTTYKLRSMGTTEKPKPKGDHHTFEQPDDYDIDPKFVSDVNYKGN